MEDVYIKVADLNKWIAKYFPRKDLISINDILTVIENLDEELEALKLEYEEFKANVDDNYKRINPADQIDYDPSLH